MKKQWCLTDIDGEFLARMEDVLDIYTQPAQEGVSRICFDERPCQLIGERIAPLPMKEKHPMKEDYEYVRQGTCVVLMAYDIDNGRRFLQVRDRRTKRDYAEFMYWLERNHYADTSKLILVQDNLNTHKYGSFYERYAPDVAHQLKNKIEFHFTPKHASWLNITEIEFSALASQALNCRIDSIEKLRNVAEAWADQRNEQQIKVCWSFTTKVARKKLKRHYDNLLTN